MNKKLFYVILVVGLVIAGLGLIILNNHSFISTRSSNQSSPINQSITTVPENLSNDPFGAPPKGIFPNCGPEDRYKFDVTINSKEDFINFLKNNKINQWVKLDSFRENPTNYPQGEIDWDKVSSAINTENIETRTIYTLDYNVISVGKDYIETCSGFTVKMTSDGYASVYGCCGK
jgi:hypothetical protein